MKSKLHVSAVFLCLTTLVACPKPANRSAQGQALVDAGLPDAGPAFLDESPVESGEYCRRTALARCAARFRCGKLDPRSLADCLEAQTAYAHCNQESLDHEVRAGRLQFHPESARTCIQDLEHASCYDPSQPGSCYDAFSGELKPGEACWVDQECLSSCNLASCPGVCNPAGGEGAPCSIEGQNLCARGFICNEPQSQSHHGHKGICTRAKQIGRGCPPGAPCYPQAGDGGCPFKGRCLFGPVPHCPPGTDCHLPETFDTPCPHGRPCIIGNPFDGGCPPGHRCVMKNPLDGGCYPGVPCIVDAWSVPVALPSGLPPFDAGCPPGMRCHVPPSFFDGGCPPGLPCTLSNTLALGETCTLGFPPDCAPGLTCQRAAGQTGLTGHCDTAVPLGGHCSDSFQCQQGSWCSPDGGTCVTFAGFDEPCDARYPVCQDYLACNHGTHRCERLPRLGEPCAAFEGCREGYCDGKQCRSKKNDGRCKNGVECTSGVCTRHGCAPPCPGR